MKIEHPRRYAVAGLGEWGITEGLVYENWEVKDFGLDEFTEDFKCYFGLDYGYTSDPTAFIAFAASREKKEIWIFDEHYGKRMLNSDIAKMIAEKGYAKERIRADAAEPKSNEDLRRLGIRRLLPSVKGPDSLINGIINISEYRIFVKPSCKNTIAELSSYCWDKREQNRPEDKNNHLMDAMRYAFYDLAHSGSTEIASYANNLSKGFRI